MIGSTMFTDYPGSGAASPPRYQTHRSAGTDFFFTRNFGLSTEISLQNPPKFSLHGSTVNPALPAVSAGATRSRRLND
jgi:hypothetical protein